MKKVNLKIIIRFLAIGISVLYITLSIFNYYNPGMKLINNNVINNILLIFCIIYLIYRVFYVILNNKYDKKDKIIKFVKGLCSTLVISSIFCFSFFVLPKFKKIDVKEDNDVNYDFEISDSQFSADVYITENIYKSKNISVELSKYKLDNNTICVADVYIKNLNNIKTAFASDTFEKGAKTDEITNIAKKNNAICAINGDFCTLSDKGLVIRNGVVYREEVEGDVCLLLKNGELKTYTESEFLDAKIDYNEIYQSWNFGPKLLDDDGNVLKTFNSEEYITKEHPRTAIGYVEPGHYKFFVIDGRNDETSGVTLEELAKFTHDFGCVQAYNLDGGASSFVTLNGSIYNNPVDYDLDGGKIRKISDVIYITE